MTRKRIASAGQRKAARQLTTDTRQFLELLIAGDDADAYNLAQRLAERGEIAYLVLAGMTHLALFHLAEEWKVTPAEALARIESSS